MLFDNGFWVYEEALSDKFCDEVIKLAKTKNESLGLIDNMNDKKELSQDDLYKLKVKRNSNLVWLKEAWIYNAVTPYVIEANKKAGWNFHFDFTEMIQFTTYRKKQFYDWHIDGWSKPYSKDPKSPDYGKARKLSVTCQLTDPSLYKGGELELDLRNYPPNKRDEAKHIYRATRKRGSIIIFPSFIWHRVKPILEGERHSLVMWNLGHPFT